MYRVNLVKNYITNVSEIINLAEQERDKFSTRKPGAPYNFATQYGNSCLKSLFMFNMSSDLKAAIFKTLGDEDRAAQSVTLNRYDPGDYLLRHRDSMGQYWKFKLIFLRSDRPHFMWYDADGVGHLVDEEPGAYLEMPINLDHEVTKIEQDEQPKYSLVLSWGI